MSLTLRALSRPRVARDSRGSDAPPPFCCCCHVLLRKENNVSVQMLFPWAAIFRVTGVPDNTIRSLNIV